MKRLTEKRESGAWPKKGWTDEGIAECLDRFAAIEDILGDEYDLDELKEVVQAKREGRCAEIHYMPAADVAPVRHGRWIEDERTYPGPGLKNNLCSACGEVAGAWKEGLEPGRKWAYCPNCGALMEKKEDEHD